MPRNPSDEFANAVASMREALFHSARFAFKAGWEAAARHYEVRPAAVADLRAENDAAGEFASAAVSDPAMEVPFRV